MKQYRTVTYMARLVRDKTGMPLLALWTKLLNQNLRYGVLFNHAQESKKQSNHWRIDGLQIFNSKARKWFCCLSKLSHSLHLSFWSSALLQVKHQKMSWMTRICLSGVIWNAVHHIGHDAPGDYAPPPSRPTGRSCSEHQYCQDWKP